MATLTTDPTDPRLTHGVDFTPRPQADAYIIAPQLAEELRERNWKRPLRLNYQHIACSQSANAITGMSLPIAETFAKDPTFYSATYCVHCRMHRPLNEFLWLPDGSVVGS